MRNKYFNLFIFLFFLSNTLWAQSVDKKESLGLVLSGGGAKGLAHIGVLLALEENNIPIDYIIGTSMGGVVGGFYAAGYSPQEIEKIATSKAFITWINGQIPEKYQYEYLKPPVSPKWLEISLGVDSTFEAEFNPQLANDLALNYELAEFMAPFDMGEQFDFDQLFVPFKAIGAEVFTQQEILLDHGNLGVALRATMSVPFVYRPIKVDGMYIFDGGIYNNFPVEPMKKHYKPDVMIGVNVSSRLYDEYPEETADEMISSSLLFMIMDKADPKELGDNGIYIEPDMAGASSFDFQNAKAIIDSGYQATMRQMDEIRLSIDRRTTDEAVEERRAEFKSSSKKLVFNKVVLDGFNSQQQKFIRKSLLTSGGIQSQDQIKENYYKLAAEPYFSDIFPKIEYQRKSQKYELHLSSAKKQKIGLQIGGNIASSNLSNIFLGARFDYLNNYLFNNYITGQIGSFYKAFSYQLRMNLAFSKPFYIAPLYDYQRYDYRNINKFILTHQKSYVVTDRQNFGFELGMPLKRSRKLTFQIVGFNQYDQVSLLPEYAQEDTLYKYQYSGIASKVGLEYSNLNKKMFPTAGKKLEAKISYRYGFRYLENESSLAEQEKLQQGILASIAYEMYFNTDLGMVGFNIKSALSSMNAFDNLQSSLLNTPAYYPTYESRSRWLPEFRAPIYLAIGLKHQIPILKKLALRTEIHGFKPITSWEQSDIVENKNGWGNLTPDYALSGMTAVIYETPIGPVSLSAHYYESDKPWSLVLNIGYLMFNRSSLD